jgi:hypothetical protein
MKRNSIVLLTVYISFLLVIAGCGGPTTYGEQISGRETTDIGDIFKNPSKYIGREVAIEGTIVRECPTGCWLDLKDDTGVVYVDINPSGFAIPQKTGSKAVVEGRVSSSEGGLSIVGKGIEIK